MQLAEHPRELLGRHVKERRVREHTVERRRREIERTLTANGFDVAGPAMAHFVYAEAGGDARDLFDALLRRGVIVRPLGSFGAPEAIRVTVGTPDENAFFAEALAALAPVA